MAITKGPDANLFKPGQSGNPSGKSKDYFKLAEHCRRYGKDAVRFVASVMLNEEAPFRDRLRAAEQLLDRGFGKPTQTTEVTGLEGGPLKIVVEVNKK